MSIVKLNTPFTHHWKCNYCGRGFFSDAPGIYELAHGGACSGSEKLELYSVDINITPRLGDNYPSEGSTKLEHILCINCIRIVINTTPGMYADVQRRESDDDG